MKRRQYKQYFIIIAGFCLASVDTPMMTTTPTLTTTTFIYDRKKSLSSLSSVLLDQFLSIPFLRFISNAVGEFLGLSHSTRAPLIRLLLQRRKEGKARLRRCIGLGYVPLFIHCCVALLDNPFVCSFLSFSVDLINHFLQDPSISESCGQWPEFF